MSEIWQTIREFTRDVLTAIIEVFKGVIAWFLDLIFNLIASAVEAIPSPEFLQENISSYIHNDILFFLTVTNFPECVAIIGAGVVFYFLRRVLTLGIW